MGIWPKRCKRCGKFRSGRGKKLDRAKYGYFYHGICPHCRFKQMRIDDQRNGRCTRCRKRPAVEDKTKCKVCLDALRLWSAERRDSQ